MKNTIFSLLFFLFLFFLTKTVEAQNENRFKIEMSFTHKGKEVLTAISSLNVNFSRDLYGDSLYAGSRYIYCSLTPMTVGKALLAAISENKAEFDILVTQTDNINKEKKQMLLKNAVFTSYNDGFSTFSYDNNYSNISLSVSAKSVIINGIEIKP